MIRKALHSPASNTFSESLKDIGKHLDDEGDLSLGDAASAREKIEKRIHDIVSAGGRPISLGGDHSVTYPIIRGLAPTYPRLTLLQIDAHPDLYPEFEGDRFSHACPFARIHDEGLVARHVQVGIRAMTEVQREVALRHHVDSIDMRKWTAGPRPSFESPVYVSIDIDGLDPAYAPGVSHREPGGLSVRDVLSLIQSLPAPVVGADIVEFNPREDVGGLTAPVCAKIVKELASKMLEA